MSFPPAGSMLFQDDYSTIYEITWETIEHNGVDLLDFTTVTKQPSVWGSADEGYVRDRIVYRRGICTTTRQIIEPTSVGYTIIAEGTSQVICTFATTFRCGSIQPLDVFTYHMSGMPFDEFDEVVTCGPRFTDPAFDLSGGMAGEDVVWADVDVTGNIIQIAGKQSFQFVDVWGDNIIPAFSCA